MAWVDELDLRGEPPWIVMGVSRAADWLLPRDASAAAQLAQRKLLLAKRSADVFAVLDGQPDAVHELVAQGRDVQDDVCALRPDEAGRHALVGGCVCFPSHWVLAEKLGRPVAEIHDPVPGYAQELQARVDSFLARLKAGQVAARRNRTVHERPDLFAPVAPRREGRPLGEWWLRSERQALCRVEGTDVVGFSIRTSQMQLAKLPADVAQRLAAQLAAEPDELAAYRGYLDVRDDLVAHLAHVASVTDRP
jgi:hypothetical protein